MGNLRRLLFTSICTLCLLSFASQGRAAVVSDLIKKGISHQKPGDDAALRKAQAYFEQANQADPKSYEAAWRIAETVLWRWEKTFDWKNQGSQEEAQLKLATHALNAAKLAHRIKPNGVEGFFYSAAALGAWGVTNGVMNSLNKLPEITKYAEGCMKADPEAKYERAGCYRFAGAIYLRTPGIWLTLPKAKVALEKAVAKYPEYGMNNNYLAEVFIKRGEPLKAIEILEKNIAMMTARKPLNYEDLRDTKRALEILEIAKSHSKE